MSADRPTYEVTVPRAVAGLAVGAAMGASISTVWLIIPNVDAWANALWSADVAILIIWLIVFGVGFGYWLLGLVLIGVPIWLALHRCGLRRSVHASLLGVVLAPAGVALLELQPIVAPPSMMIRGHGPLALIGFALFIAAIGGMVGIVVWRVAYRKPANHSHHSAQPRPN